MINNDLKALSSLAFLDSVELLGLTNIPYALLEEESDDTTYIYSEYQQLYALYSIYRYGCMFSAKAGGTPSAPNSDLRFRKAANLIKKEARFMFASTPDIKVEPKTKTNGVDDKNEVAGYQALVDAVLDKNRFADRLLKAARDCFIGKRIALMVNFNDHGIQISFIDSMHFFFKFDDVNTSDLVKFVAFETTTESEDGTARRLFKKKYTKENGVVYLEETLCDGNNNVVQVVTPRRPILLKYIPASVVLNDGLLSDIRGVSDLQEVAEPESTYSRLANADIDALDKNMNPTRYTVDMDQDTTAKLNYGPGAYWDLHTAQDQNEVHPIVGTLAPNMEHSEPIKSTLDRIKNQMYDTLEIPDLNTESLQGIVSSGKTLKAIYWPLIVRCDEKFKTWEPALQFLASTIIEGARLYPKSMLPYEIGDLPTTLYQIATTNNYPLPEDEDEEKTIDIMEVNANLMSRRSYMEKWRGMTAEEADAELERIAEEANILAGGQDAQDGTVPPVNQSDTFDISVLDEDGDEGDTVIEDEGQGQTREQDESFPI